MARYVGDAFQSATALAASDTVTTADPGRNVLISCTTAGNVKLGLADGSTVTIDVVAGSIVLPLQVAQFFVTGTTATATVSKLN